mmetsp:Transcript_61669/g.121104  ORF Transcript_61669/g.121104 Transcript_61669/m.121104 type:complete len:99 (+) Transcript_61669:141-437(+)
MTIEEDLPNRGVKAGVGEFLLVDGGIKIVRGLAGSNSRRRGQVFFDLSWAWLSPVLRNTPALYLKTHFEYLRKNCRRALKPPSSWASPGSNDAAAGRP